MYIFDFDGTLSNSDHRQHLADEKRWDEFHSRALIDEPRKEIIELYKLLKSQTYTGILTAKPEKYREDVLYWLKRNNLPDPDFLHMRPTGSLYIKATVLKLEICNKIKASYSRDILMVFDDREDIVDMLIKNKIPAIRV